MIDQFEFCKLPLDGAYLIKPFVATDERGALIKDYNADIFDANGLDYNLKEVFYTVSQKGVIRAIHFQLEKQQAKLVRCIKGRVFDVIVDLRVDSQSYGKYLAFELSDLNNVSLLIPQYFGHGYLVLEDSVVSYKCAETFYSPGDSGIMFDDPSIGIAWPFESIGGVDKIIISEKDKKLMSFKQYTELMEKGNG